MKDKKLLSIALFYFIFALIFIQFRQLKASNALIDANTCFSRGKLIFTSLKIKNCSEKQAATIDYATVLQLHQLYYFVSYSKILIKSWVHIDKEDDAPNKFWLRKIHKVEYPALKKKLLILNSKWDSERIEIINELIVSVDKLFLEQQLIMTKLDFYDSYADVNIMFDVMPKVEDGGVVVNLTDNILKRIESLITLPINFGDIDQSIWKNKMAILRLQKFYFYIFYSRMLIANWVSIDKTANTFDKLWLKDIHTKHYSGIKQMISPTQTNWTDKELNTYQNICTNTDTLFKLQQNIMLQLNKFRKYENKKLMENITPLMNKDGDINILTNKILCRLDILTTRLKKSKKLDLSFKQLQTLPDDIAILTDLEELNLEFNELTTLPNEISTIKTLKKVYLNNNQLSALPKDFSKLKNLKYLDLRNNKIPKTKAKEISQTMPLTKISFGLSEEIFNAPIDFSTIDKTETGYYLSNLYLQQIDFVADYSLLLTKNWINIEKADTTLDKTRLRHIQSLLFSEIKQRISMLYPYWTKEDQMEYAKISALIDEAMNSQLMIMIQLGEEELYEKLTVMFEAKSKIEKNGELSVYTNGILRRLKKIMSFPDTLITFHNETPDITTSEYKKFKTLLYLHQLYNYTVISGILTKIWIYDKTDNSTDKIRLKELTTNKIDELKKQIAKSIKTWETNEQEIFNDACEKLDKVIKEQKSIMQKLSKEDNYNDILTVYKITPKVEDTGSLTKETEYILAKLKILIENKQEELFY